VQGKRVVITGASRGIGRQTALALGGQGAHLGLVVRNKELGDTVAEEVKALGAGGDVEVYVGDLSSLAEVRRVAEEFLEKHDKLDVLVNNAGALLMERKLTKDGYEATFATNHLAYFLMADKLLHALEKTPGARIVNVASEAHRRGKMTWDDLMGEKSYFGFFAYCQSKLANILFSRELSKRLEGKDVTTNSLHPGAIASSFALNNTGIVPFLWRLASPFLLNEKNGAKTQIFLASDPSVAKTTGKYFDKCKERRPSREASDDDAAKKLWDITEDLVADFA
jgi:NAD(P)-dependent dehydrogenase (short-subunit alcohol dehydrogenase family)